MNKLIEKFAEQVNLLGDFTPTKIDGRYVGYINVADIEKFAELIVKECATAIINDRRLNDVRSAANGCVRTIKEHFGVEE